MDENAKDEYVLDGYLEYQIAVIREWFGLKEGQSFKDIPEE